MRHVILKYMNSLSSSWYCIKCPTKYFHSRKPSPPLGITSTVVPVHRSTLC